MSSAACTSRCQRSQVSPSCPSIMMPTRMTWPPVVFGIPVGSRALMYTATAGRVPRDKLCFAAAMAPSQRLLLLIPTTTYRTEDFVDAARSLDVDLVIASDRPNVMATEFPDHLLTLPFADPAAPADRRGGAGRRRHHRGGLRGGRGARSAGEPARRRAGHPRQAGDARAARGGGGALAVVHRGAGRRGSRRGGPARGLSLRAQAA